MVDLQSVHNLALKEFIMKSLFRRTVTTVLFFMTFFVFSTMSESSAGETETERLSQVIDMFTAVSSKDPYSVMYNINLTAPGRISVLIRKPEGTFNLTKRGALFRIKIADARGYKPGSRFIEKKYIRKAVSFQNERGLVEYSVDSIELEKSKGNYIVLISNFYQKRPYQAHLQIMYPVTKSAEQKLKPVMQLKPVVIKGLSEENLDE